MEKTCLYSSYDQVFITTAESRGQMADCPFSLALPPLGWKTVGASSALLPHLWSKSQGDAEHLLSHANTFVLCDPHVTSKQPNFSRRQRKAQSVLTSQSNG